MRMVKRLGALALAFIGAAAAAAAQAPAGEVTLQRGSTLRLAGDQAQSLALGLPVFAGDRIATRAGARLEITFADGSALTLGENAEVVIDAFVTGAGGGQALSMLTGVFRFATGAIGRADPSAVRFATPVAVIGVRGTAFGGGELAVGMPPGQKHYGFQIIEGAITVAAPGGTVVLDEPGEGTFLPLARVAAPTTPAQWSPEASAELVDALAF